MESRSALGRGIRGWQSRGNEDGQTIRQPTVQIATREAITAFLRAPATERNERRKISVTFTTCREENELQPVFQADLSPDNELETGFLRSFGFLHRLMGAHHPGNRALIGYRQCLV